MRRYRRGAVFDMHAQFFTKLDRNERAKIIVNAEATERRTKAKGKQAGAIGQSGLRVLRELLLTFHNAATGRCDPSYTKLQEKTGYCRDTISKALHRLETSGLLRITRRMVRIGGNVRQIANAYSFFTRITALPYTSPEPSLLFGEQPLPERFIPYGELEGSLRTALDRLGARIRGRPEQKSC